MRTRIVALLVMTSLSAAACGNGQTGGKARAVTAGVLGALAVGAGAGAAVAARKSSDHEKDLTEAVAAGRLTGREFTDRDAEGKRWNRLARGAVFVSGLAVVGMILVWETGLGASYQYGPAETPRDSRLIPGASPAAPGTPPSSALLPRPAAQRSADSK